eukprot:GHVP01051451.1.p1 GENE.GHVP01051451.1~~GHVP01051451.1.p1  ORF type:complete len:139 (+),score=31.05 GHVP01051451.1:212-628(+)
MQEICKQIYQETQKIHLGEADYQDDFRFCFEYRKSTCKIARCFFAWGTQGQPYKIWDELNGMDEDESPIIAFLFYLDSEGNVSQTEGGGAKIPCFSVQWDNLQESHQNIKQMFGILESKSLKNEALVKKWLQMRKKNL